MNSLARLLLLAPLCMAPLLGCKTGNTSMDSSGPRTEEGRLAPGVAHELQAVGGARYLAFFGQPSQSRVIVYLHGKCDSARPALDAIGASLAQQGHVVAPVGTEACPNGQTMWTADITQLDRQIQAAVDAAQRASGLTFDTSDEVLVGYSQGAYRGEALAAQQPRYRRLILIGSPEVPAVDSFAHTSAVALLAGSLDRQDIMKQGEKNLENAGKRVEFLVLPGAEHGAFGPEGARVMSDAMTFVLSPPRG